MKAYFLNIKQTWRNAFCNKVYRTDLMFGLVMLLILLVFTYFYFDYIEHLPSGVVLNDWVLSRIPAKDVSTPIVFFEASAFIIIFARSSTNPIMFLTFLLSAVLIFATRDITIGITHLRAPLGIIELKDPIACMIYRCGFVTRDLFYSGHESFVFLIYLCVNTKLEKYYMLFAVISIGILLLMQHVHYFADVASAPFFSFICYWVSKRILQQQHIEYIYNT